jgi:hypothetical protein
VDIKLQLLIRVPIIAIAVVGVGIWLASVIRGTSRPPWRAVAGCTALLGAELVWASWNIFLVTPVRDNSEAWPALDFGLLAVRAVLEVVAVALLVSAAFRRAEVASPAE